MMLTVLLLHMVHSPTLPHHTVLSCHYIFLYPATIFCPDTIYYPATSQCPACHYILLTVLSSHYILVSVTLNCLVCCSGSFIKVGEIWIVLCLLL